MRELILAAAVLALSDPRPSLQPRSDAVRPEETVATIEPGQRLPFARGALLGTLVLSEVWLDARGHRVAPGRYALRYALQPRLKDHLGVDAVRDFALLVPEGVPAGADPLGSARHALDSRHPVVMELRPAASDGADSIRLDDGRRALVARIATVAIAFVIEPGSEGSVGF